MSAAEGDGGDGGGTGPARSGGGGGRTPPRTTCIVIGMAGSGKTTFMQRAVAYLSERRHGPPPYVINLDPAVANVPYRTNIDIRDTIDYKSVMQTYNLGPNGAIVTSLNLFATRFDQVVDLITCSDSAAAPDYCLLDTPGQIEVFTWSASGQIITESLAATGPTVIVYVVDTPRSQSPTTFMSNMTYACSIMYRTRLPFLIVFNKADVLAPRFAQRWMADVEAFEEALCAERPTFMSTLTRSLAFVMDEFYRSIRSVAVSAVTGHGMDEFFACLDACADEYRADYLPFREARLRERHEQVEALKRERLQQVEAQIADDDVVVDGRKTSSAPEPSTDDDDESESDPEPFDNFDYEQDRRDYEEFMSSRQQ